MDVIIASKQAVIAENKGKKDTDETTTTEDKGQENTQEKNETKVEEKMNSIPKLTGNARRNKYLNAKKEKENDTSSSSSGVKKVGLGTKAMSETSGP